MINRYIAIILACAGIISAVVLSIKMAKPIPAAAVQEEPAKNPYMTAISAPGIIEAVNEHIAVGSQTSGIINHIYKDICQPVKKGEPLLCLDTSELVAEEKVKKARVKVAQAKLERVKDQFERLQSIQDIRAVSINELRTKENDVLVAASELEEAIADLEWIQTKIETMTLRAPQDGVIIQKKAKIGEHLSQSGKDPAFIIGELSRLQIRADIDEQNASWVKPGSPASAFPKNKPDKALPLQFVRIEPYVIPKKSLTGLSDERVDTRVLQVIYTLEPPADFALYVGQQVDVFIDLEDKS